MKKYFCCSDIHSFYDEWMQALEAAGFDFQDPDHILIVCGDIFDRGPQTLEVYNFLREFPKERRILIRGNHEILFKELVKAEYPTDADYHNGTFKSVLSLQAARDVDDFDISYLLAEVIEDFVEKFNKKIGLGPHESIFERDNSLVSEYYDERRKVIQNFYKRYFKAKILKDVIKWIDSDEWLNYYELGSYIFVHSFIPITIEENAFGDSKYRYQKDWRNASQKDWNDAMWGCPWKQYLLNLFKPEEEKGKILVCGHWHASDFWNRLEYAHKQNKWLDLRKENPIFMSKNFPGIIALDACTAATHRVNVLGIDENNCIFYQGE